MCGVFGAVGATVQQDILNHVLKLLHHRGPDDYGYKYFDDCVLAATRLSIVDLTSAGHMPMSDVTGEHWLVFNGEIYNYLELRDELREYPFSSRSDTEVLLAAYRRWGVECLDHLRGMFAFGLWDSGTRTLWCATDRFSIKPLYYTVRDGAIWFASEIKPLLASGVSAAPDEQAIYDYLAYGQIDHNEHTLFRNIQQLRPGTMLRFQDGDLLVRRYWDLTDSHGHTSLDETEVEEILDEAVHIHMSGDVQIAVSLSSGLDSNLLRAKTASYFDENTPGSCFVYSFPGTVYDEAVKADRILSEDPRWQLFRTEVSSKDLLENLSTATRDVEGPIGGLGYYGYWLNAKNVNRAGIKVILDGQGSDEVFGGYQYYYGQYLGQLDTAGQIDKLRSELSDFNQVHGSNIEYPSPAFSALTMPRDNQNNLIRAPDGTTMVSDYIAPDFAQSYSGQTYQFPQHFDCPVRQSRYLDLFHFKIPKLLRLQDKCAMASSVEVRVPYLDHVLVQQLFSLPTERFLGAGRTKIMLRDISERSMPAWNHCEPKLYVATPQREWVKSNLQTSILEMINTSVLARGGYVDANRLSDQYADYCRDVELGNSFFVWKFIALELWYREFIS